MWRLEDAQRAVGDMLLNDMYMTTGDDPQT